MVPFSRSWCSWHFLWSWYSWLSWRFGWTQRPWCCSIVLSSWSIQTDLVSQKQQRWPRLVLIAALKRRHGSRKRRSWSFFCQRPVPGEHFGLANPPTIIHGITTLVARGLIGLINRFTITIWQWMRRWLTIGLVYMDANAPFLSDPLFVMSIMLASCLNVGAFRGWDMIWFTPWWTTSRLLGSSVLETPLQKLIIFRAFQYLCYCYL